MIESREPLTIKKELEWAVPFLSASNNTANARLEAEVLLAKVLNWERVKVLAHLLDPISGATVQDFRRLIQKRAEGYPLQYLTGSQEFMSLAFKVTPAVLIPRDDTQVLVETVLSLKPQVKPNPSIVDVGTGSGIIAVVLKKYWPEAKIFGVDISPKALEVAKANAENHQVEITFYRGDLLTPFRGNHTFDIIVSNPPYIPSRDIKNLQAEVTQEPVLALDGGPDGLEFYRRLAKTAPDCLIPGGWLAVEIGSEQGEGVKRIFTESHFKSVKVVQDYAGLDRVVYGVKS